MKPNWKQKEVVIDLINLCHGDVILCPQTTPSHVIARTTPKKIKIKVALNCTITCFINVGNLISSRHLMTSKTPNNVWYQRWAFTSAKTILCNQLVEEPWSHRAMNSPPYLAISRIQK